ncbi:hypothetical protein ACV229_22670 [Burkholderia sp. MR1-5-21]
MNTMLELFAAHRNTFDTNGARPVARFAAHDRFATRIAVCRRHASLLSAVTPVPPFDTTRRHLRRSTPARDRTP